MKIFKWLKHRSTRIIILAITLISTILALTLGSVLYTSKNTKTSIDYGGGAQIVVQIQNQDGSVANQAKTKEVFKNIVKHVDPLGLGGVAQSSIIGKNGYITVSKGDIKTIDQITEFENKIKIKPIISIFNIADKPLFVNGVFSLGQKTTNPIAIEKRKLILNGDDEVYKINFKHDSAKPVFQNNKWVVKIELKDSFTQLEWTKATTYMSKQKNKQMIVWLGHQQLLKKVLDQQQTKGILFKKFIESRFNLYSFIHVDLSNPLKKPEDQIKIKKPYKWDKLFVNQGLKPAKNYIVSVASVNRPLYGSSFVIEGNFTHNQALRLANNINYGASDYRIKHISSYFLEPTYGLNAFDKAIIGGIIVFALIAIFMIVNYGLLGALSIISIALYMFLTLTIFTVMRGEYSPETIAALIIGIGMSIDANIITFERLKQEIYKNATPSKAHAIANKISLTTIFDANITTLIVAFVLFYLGTASVKGFSIMLMLSIVFTLLVMLLFTRIISTLLVKLNVFNNRIYLLGVYNLQFSYLKKQKLYPKYLALKQKGQNFDYMKSSKWFLLGSGIFISIAVLVFTILVAIAGQIANGVNSSMEFTGGSIVNISGKQTHAFSTQRAQQIRQALIDKNLITIDEAKIVYADTKQENAKIKIETKKSLTHTQVIDTLRKIKNEQPSLEIIFDNYNIVSQVVTSDVAQGLVQDALIAIFVAMIAIILYTLIRFKWTYSIAAIVALIHDGLIVTAIFVITRVELSPIFIAGLLSVIGYSINDTIVTFDHVREQLKHNLGKLDSSRLRKLANRAIKQTFKRSLLTSLTTIFAILILLTLGNATKFSFNIAILVGVISGTYSSIFIATYIWVNLESFSQKRIAKRQNKQFWKLKHEEEQIVEGINDYNY